MNWMSLPPSSFDPGDRSIYRCNMSDTSNEGGRRHLEGPQVQRLEKILSKNRGEPHHSDPIPSRTLSDTVAEQPLRNRVSVDGLCAGTGHEAVRFICGMCSRIHVCTGASTSKKAWHTKFTRSLCFQAQARRHTGDGLEELECSTLEHALKEQVFRLAGQWEQGAAQYP